MTDRMASGRGPRLAHSRAPQGSARGTTDTRALIAKIHVAKKRLALTDESYRDMLRVVIDRDTTKGASVAQLDQVLRHLATLGFKATRARPDHRPIVRKIIALWRDLAPYRNAADDEVADRAALNAFVQRQAGVTDLQFLDVDGATKVLEGLKGWLARVEGKARRVAA